MTGSTGSTVFRLFDKIIVAVLALLALFYLAVTMVREPAGEVSTTEVAGLIKGITARQAASGHKPTQRTADYRLLTVGGFRPDSVGIPPRSGVMGGGTVEPSDEDTKPILLTEGETDATPYARRVRPTYAGATIEVGDQKVATTEWSADPNQPVTLLVRAVARGVTKIRIVRDRLPPLEIPVIVKPKETVPSSIEAPVNLTATGAQGQIEVAWGIAAAHNATVREYRVYRAEDEARGEAEGAAEGEAGGEAEAEAEGAAEGEAEGEAKDEAKQAPTTLYLRVPVAADLADGASLRTVLADDRPGPAVTFQKGRFSLIDRAVQGGVTYVYAVDAAGVDAAVAPLAGPKAGPVVVHLEEGFIIKFLRGGPDTVCMAVSVFYLPKDGTPGPGRWVEYPKFFVERGGMIGALIPDVRASDGTHIKDVPFATGYQVLDILNGERTIRTVIGKRQYEETRQKVLIINERGRIKVLWPAVPGR